MTELPLNQVLCGDCREVMKDFPENSIDLVVTDPPYGLQFMGKDWDKTLPPKEAFKQIIRILKPGAIAFVNSSPRQDLFSRMIGLLEKAGFKTDVSYLDWIYKTGFPKAYDISKGIDKKLLQLQFFDEIRNYLIYWRDKNGLTNSEINRKLGYAITGSGMAGHWFGNITQQTLPTKEQWFKLKELLRFDEQFDSIYLELRDGVDRPKIGRDAHWGKNGVLPWHGKEWDITKSYSELAKKWDGWKSLSGLKPAHEPIIMAYKPFSESTIVDNVLKWDTGAINVDTCRIPFKSEDDKEKSKVGFEGTVLNPETGWNPNSMITKEYDPPNKGRFPANLLVSDKALDTGEITRRTYIKEDYQQNRSGEFLSELGHSGPQGYNDIGDQSRYFDLDAWAEHHGFLDVPKPDNTERDFGLRGKKKVPKSKFNLSDGSKDMRFDGVIPTPRRNTHPTVKPIKLMAYLIELGCPPNGIVLDPFVGTGTTCIAAKKLARKYVGIEIKPEYVTIAKARISAYPVPLDWFDEEVGVVPPKVNRK